MLILYSNYESYPTQAEMLPGCVLAYPLLVSAERGSVDGWGTTYATCRKVTGSIPDVIAFFNLPNPSTRTMTLRSTQPLTEMSTRNIPGGKGRPTYKADNLTAVWEPIV
jgi:hypothetical protein